MYKKRLKNPTKLYIFIIKTFLFYLRHNISRANMQAQGEIPKRETAKGCFVKNSIGGIL
jgi:hypothetical protein